MLFGKALVPWPNELWHSRLCSQYGPPDSSSFSATQTSCQNGENNDQRCPAQAAAQEMTAYPNHVGACTNTDVIRNIIYTKIVILDPTGWDMALMGLHGCGIEMAEFGAE